MEITGIVHEIGDVQQVTDTYKKRNLIIKYSENPQFEEFIQFELVQDRVALADELEVGDEVEVAFNLRGRPWTNREGVTQYFNSLVAWRVKGTGRAEPQDDPTPEPVVESTGDSEDDDLPF